MEGDVSVIVDVKKVTVAMVVCVPKKVTVVRVVVVEDVSVTVGERRSAKAVAAGVKMGAVVVVSSETTVVSVNSVTMDVVRWVVVVVMPLTVETIDVVGVDIVDRMPSTVIK